MRSTRRSYRFGRLHLEFKDQVLSIHGLSKEQTLGRFGDLEAKKIVKGDPNL